MFHYRQFAISAFVAVMVATVFVSCGTDKSGVDLAGRQANPAASPSPVAVSIPANAQNLGADAFGQNPLTINVGQTVTWTNNDTIPHTVTADDGSFDSGNLAPGATFSHTFDTAGEFPYHCSIHPGMTGMVVAQSASPSPGPSTSPSGNPSTTPSGAPTPAVSPSGNPSASPSPTESVTPAPTDTSTPLPTMTSQPAPLPTKKPVQSGGGFDNGGGNFFPGDGDNDNDDHGDHHHHDGGDNW